MKQTWFVALALVFLICLGPAASLALQNDFAITELENGTCIISGYSGEASSVIIPNEIEGKTVVGIGEYAFLNCKTIEEVQIPDSVHTIGHSAFYQCLNLKSITLPESLVSIGPHAFYLCHKVESLELPKGLKTIGSSAFSSMEALQSINIPDSVTEIGPWAFSFCKSLLSIEIPDSITRIETGAFHGCYSLRKVTIPASVTFFGDDAFSWCDLCEIWGESASAAEAYAKELGVLFVPITVSNSSQQESTSGKVYLAGTRVIDDFKIEAYADGTCGIKDYYGGNSHLVIPEYVGEYRVVEICECYSFGLYKGITSVFIPEGVVRMNNNAFLGCSITEMWIPDSLVEFSPYALDLCDEMEVIHVSQNHPFLRYENDCLIDKRNNRLILFCGQQSSFTIPSGISIIGYDAFYGRYNLQTVIIPGTVEIIENGAFSFCRYLESVTLMEGVQRIDELAFSSCSHLKTVNFPQSLTEIGEEAFSYTDLEYVVIPPSVKQIGQNAFDNSCIIFGSPGSAAEAYAREHETTFMENNSIFIFRNSQ